MGYIVASQALMAVGGWSRLGFIFAALLFVLLLVGYLLRIGSLPLGNWVFLPLVFVSYCLARGVPEVGQEWPSDALFSLITAFLGGIGVGMGIQAGVPFRALVYAQVISSLCQIGAGLYGIGTEPQGGEEEVRYAGLAGNANELGLQLTLGACLIWFLPKKAGAAACALALAAVAYAICTTGSRKAFLMMPVFLFLVSIQMAAYIKKHRALFALAGIVGLGLAGIILTPTILENAKDITAISRTLDPYDSSFDKRSGMAHQAVRLWHEAPLFGNGTDAFRRLSGYGTYAHNNYAELLCDLGIAGTMLFYAVHLYILFMCLRLPLPLRVYCCVFVLLLLVLDIGYVSYYRKQTVMILMVLASIVTSCHRVRQTAKGPSAGQMSTARPVGRPGFTRLPVRG